MAVMEGKPQIQSRKRLDGASPEPPASGANTSSHVIDLRKSGGADARPRFTPPVARPRQAPVKTRAKALEEPTFESEVAPEENVFPDPVPAEQQKEPQRREQQLQELAPLAPAADLPPARGRFWSAFWRFLFLLILLGLIITGGLYFYINYFKS